MDRSETERFIKSLYVARVDGDLAALSAAFAEDAVFKIAGSPEVSMLATTAEGHEAIRTLLQTMTDTFVLEDFTILDLLVAEGQTAVRWRATVNVVTAGQTYETEVADFIELKDDQVISFVEFLDTALAG